MGAMLLDGITDTGQGAPVRVGRKGDYGVLVWFTLTGGGAACTNLVCQLEGKIKHNNPAAPDAWSILGSAKTFSAGERTAQAGYFFVTDSPVDEVRLNLTTLTHVDTCTVYAALVERE